jgi:CysZ protein
MSPTRKSPLFVPITRAFGQLDDQVFVGVAVRSVAWSAACFAAIYAAAVGIVHWLLDLHGVWAWVAAIGTLYFDRIALAVERRFYPWLPPPQGASLIAQTWDGIAVAGQVLMLNAVALILTLMIPGIGLVLGWMIATYAVGRGLFVAVAMRRMPRAAAESLYQSQRGVVLLNGGILAAAAYVPFINLLIPVIGTAAMVHVLDIALSAMNRPRASPL